MIVLLYISLDMSPFVCQVVFADACLCITFSQSIYFSGYVDKHALFLRFTFGTASMFLSFVYLGASNSFLPYSRIIPNYGAFLVYLAAFKLIIVKIFSNRY